MPAMPEEVYMLQQPIRKVWVFPPKYWAATERMTESERENMMQEILDLAERGDTEALKKFDFLSLEDPYLLWKKSA
jgi:hypothetical protein